MAKSKVARLRSPRRVEPSPAPPEKVPFTRSEDVLDKVELLWTAMMGLHFRAQAEVLDADDDIAPVLHLAGDIRASMTKLHKELEAEMDELRAERAAAARRKGVA